MVLAKGSDLLPKLLEWPALAFVLVILFSLLFYRPLKGALSRGDFVLSWGEGRSITLNQLPSSLSEELDPLRDEIEALKAAVAALEKGAAPAAAPPVEPPGTRPLSEADQAAARAKMMEALSSGKYLWRSIERLAVIAGVSEEQALDMLRAEREVVLGMGKSQRQIARLKSRTA